MFQAVIFQEGKRFSCKSVPLALRIGDQLLAGFVYRCSLVFLLEPVCHLSSMLEKALF